MADVKVREAEADAITQADFEALRTALEPLSEARQLDLLSNYIAYFATGIEETHQVPAEEVLEVLQKAVRDAIAINRKIVQ